MFSILCGVQFDSANFSKYMLHLPSDLGQFSADCFCWHRQRWAWSACYSFLSFKVLNLHVGAGNVTTVVPYLIFIRNLELFLRTEGQICLECVGFLFY